MTYNFGIISTNATTALRGKIGLFQFIEFSTTEQFLFWLKKLEFDEFEQEKILRNWKQGRRKRALRLFLENFKRDN